MSRYVKTFSPVEKIMHTEETVGQKLQRLARASLPVYPAPKVKNYSKREQKCICGKYLPSRPKTRQGQKVCDECAVLIPRLHGGAQWCYKCDGCLAPVPRRSLKMKNGELYCKKCLKIKFHIDF
jgi:hypothetical protein